MKMFDDFLGERKISQKFLDDYKAVKLEEYSVATVKTMLLGRTNIRYLSVASFKKMIRI